MKKFCIAFTIMIALLVVAVTSSKAKGKEQVDSPVNPCLNCHKTETPGIVRDWEKSKHSKVGVKCYVCHKAKKNDPSGYDHYDFQITAVPSPNYCASCHPKAVEQNSKSKHAWAAFMGPLKPYYKKARELGLDPLSLETARKLNPEKMAKRTLSPLFPDSGILQKIGLLKNPKYNHNNVNLGCIQCHGSFIIPEKKDDEVKLKGWPNTGIGRINPDGSMGSCTACHTRHKFSVAEARKPETCGQCHLGPDHPQYEIYQESKHGNIYAANGHKWNWTAKKWSTKHIGAPTCATCHMSGFGDKVKGTHNVGRRLYWELQSKKSVPQWKGPDKVDMVLNRVPDIKAARRGRAEMKQVCYQCHSPQWSDKYFVEFDKVVNDYNMLWDKVDGMLKKAYKDGLISKANPLDETPEIMHYLIWHHDGRRWRMGASMMAPDWTHWNGAVDAILNKLGWMINDLEMRKRLKKLEKISSKNKPSSRDLGIRINLAGRQRMLTQKMSKEILLIALGIEKQKNTENLSETASLFAKRLDGLINGDPNLGLVQTSNKNVLAQLVKVTNHWNGFIRDSVNPTLKGKPSKVVLKKMAEKNIPLLNSMDKVVKMYEKLSQSSLSHKMAVTINLAGKQRMLTQKMTKEFYLVALAIQKEKNRANLAKSVVLFDQTLKGLLGGDKSLDLDGTKDKSIRSQLNLVDNLWKKYKALLGKAVSGNFIDNADLLQAYKLNLPLLKAMNKVVKMYELSVE